MGEPTFIANCLLMLQERAGAAKRIVILLLLLIEGVGVYIVVVMLSPYGTNLLSPHFCLWRRVIAFSSGTCVNIAVIVVMFLLVS